MQRANQLQEYMTIMSVEMYKDTTYTVSAAKAIIERLRSDISKYLKIAFKAQKEYENAEAEAKRCNEGDPRLIYRIIAIEKAYKARLNAATKYHEAIKDLEHFGEKP